MRKDWTTMPVVEIPAFGVNGRTWPSQNNEQHPETMVDPGVAGKPAATAPSMATQFDAATKQLAAEGRWQRFTDRVALGGNACPPESGGAPDGWALVVFIVMLFGFAGRMMHYGRDFERLHDDPREDAVGSPDQRRWGQAAIVLAVLAELCALFFYYQCYRRCRSVLGFTVFVVATAVFGFIVQASVRPRHPAWEDRRPCSGKRVPPPQQA